MDLFVYLEEYRVVVCRSCATGIIPKYLVTHIWAHHRARDRAFGARRMVQREIEEQLRPTVL